ncbi:MAG TPA: hypothetical protein VHO06_24250 [Polyangia bacterium]|nr:hypothetical protein [Polyangia bacterium]
MRKSLTMAAFVALGLAAAGSAIGCDSVEEAFDCQQVCQRYRDCYDSSYDVGGCEDRCRTNAANDPNVKNDADTCESCIGDKSCLSATFTCGGSCGAIVP